MLNDILKKANGCYIEKRIDLNSNKTNVRESIDTPIIDGLDDEEGVRKGCLLDKQIKIIKSCDSK